MFVHPCDFVCCSLVAPDDGLSQHVVILIQHYQTVHLSRNADALDIVLVYAALRHYSLDGVDHRACPVSGVLFSVAVFRLIHWVLDGL